MVRMTPEEITELNAKVAQTQMSREEYLRELIRGNQPVAKPDIEYAEVLKQLHYIGNNIRQLAIKAYYTNNVEGERFKQYSRELDQVVGRLTNEMGRRTTC